MPETLKRDKKTTSQKKQTKKKQSSPRAVENRITKDRTAVHTPFAGLREAAFPSGVDGNHFLKAKLGP